MSYLALANRILHNELTEEELIDCLNIPNVLVVQYAILKIIEKKISNSDVRNKLLDYSKCMDSRFKILALLRIGHLAIYALKRLDFIEEFQTLYEKLSDEDKEQVMLLEKVFS